MINGYYQYIDTYAFSGCTYLSSVTIPDSLNYIYDGAFSSCPLTCLNWNAVARYIASNVFNNGVTPPACTGIFIILLSYYDFLQLLLLAPPTKSPTVLPSYALNRPTPIPSLNPSVQPTLNPTLYPSVQPTQIPTAKPTTPTNAPTISPTSTPYLCSEPFFYSVQTDDFVNNDDGGQSSAVVKGMLGQTCCGGYANVILNTSVTVIDHKSFYGCTNLQSMIIPSSVTFIGNLAFARSSINTITLPTTIKSISKGAFKESYLTSISIPTSCTYIGIFFSL